MTVVSVEKVVMGVGAETTVVGVEVINILTVVGFSVTVVCIVGTSFGAAAHPNTVVYTSTSTFQDSRGSEGLSLPRMNKIRYERITIVARDISEA